MIAGSTPIRRAGPGAVTAAPALPIAMAANSRTPPGMAAASKRDPELPTVMAASLRTQLGTGGEKEGIPVSATATLADARIRLVMDEEAHDPDVRTISHFCHEARTDIQCER